MNKKILLCFFILALVVLPAAYAYAYLLQVVLCYRVSAGVCSTISLTNPLPVISN